MDESSDIVCVLYFHMTESKDWNVCFFSLPVTKMSKSSSQQCSSDVHKPRTRDLGLAIENDCMLVHLVKPGCVQGNIHSESFKLKYPLLLFHFCTLMSVHHTSCKTEVKIHTYAHTHTTRTQKRSLIGVNNIWYWQLNTDPAEFLRGWLDRSPRQNIRTADGYITVKMWKRNT